MKDTNSKSYYVISSFFIVALLVIGAVIIFQANLLEVIKTSFLFVNSGEIVRRLAIYKWLSSLAGIYLLFCFFYRRYEKNKKIREERLAEKILQEQSERGGV